MNEKGRNSTKDYLFENINNNIYKCLLSNLQSKLITLIET
jgi:hypothetical protein